MMENFVNAQVFKTPPLDEEKAMREHLTELRKYQMQLSGIAIRTLLEYGIEWQEVTGKLLEMGNRPGAREKFEDAERRRRELNALNKTGRLKA